MTIPRIKHKVIILIKSNESTISIPKDLAEKLGKRAKNKGFGSLSSYVTYVLRQILSSIETDEKKQNKAFTKEGEKKVKRRLRELGYLD